MEKPQKKNKKRSRFRRYRLIIGGVLILLSSFFLIMLFVKPADYDDEIGPYPAYGTQSRYLTNEIMPAIYNNHQRGRPFEITITQTGANDILRHSDVPYMLANSGVTNPQIRMTNDKFVFMVSANAAGANVVVTFGLNAQIDEEGLMNISVDKLKFGSADISLFWPFIARQVLRQYEMPDVVPDEADYWPERITAAVLKQQSFEPILSFAGMEMRVEDIQISPGELTARLEPLN